MSLYISPNHRMYATKSEPECKRGTLGDVMMCQYRFVNCPTLVERLTVGEAVHVGAGQREYGKSLTSLLILL